MRVILMPCDKRPFVTEIDGSLESMQKLVGGYIEPAHIAPGIVEIVNEEGGLQRLPWNYSSYIEGIHGDAFLCAVRGLEFVGLTDEQINYWLPKVQKIYGGC